MWYRNVSNSLIGDPNDRSAMWTLLASPLFTERNMSKIQEWRTICSANHKTCRKTVSTVQPMPTRVIEARPHDLSNDHVRLLNSSRLMGAYACLSYCWGKLAEGTSRAMTKTSNIGAHMTGIPLSELPEVIQDAIKLCRRLDIAYIWIDALCIVQDDPEDWKREAVQMERIYGNSILTISTPHNSHAHDSISTRKVTNAYMTQIQWVYPGTSASSMLLLQRTSLITSVEHFPSPLRPSYTPWMRRGWTLQEWLLSPRVLHCADSIMIWDCFHESWFENTWDKAPGFFSEESSLRQQYRRLQLAGTSHWFRLDIETRTDFEVLWEEIVQNFTSREFTFDTDKLTALSGLAKRFMEAPEVEVLAPRYLAGMWSFEKMGTLSATSCINVPRALLWHRQTDDFLTTPSAYLAPSWSWAALNGKINSSSDFYDADAAYEFEHGESHTSVSREGVVNIKIRSLECIYEQPGSLSRSCGGWIDADCAIRKAWLHSEKPSWEKQTYLKNDRDTLGRSFTRSFRIIGTRRSENHRGSSNDWVAVFDQEQDATGPQLYVIPIMSWLYYDNGVEVNRPGQMESGKELWSATHLALILRKENERDDTNHFQRLGIAWNHIGREKVEEECPKNDSREASVWWLNNMLEDWDRQEIRLV